MRSVNSQGHMVRAILRTQSSLRKRGAYCRAQSSRKECGFRGTCGEDPKSPEPAGCDFMRAWSSSWKRRASQGLYSPFYLSFNRRGNPVLFMTIEATVFPPPVTPQSTILLLCFFGFKEALNKSLD